MKKNFFKFTLILCFFTLTAFDSAKLLNKNVIEKNKVNSPYNEGWKDGHCEGWKEIKGQNAYCPYAPYPPYPKYPKSTDSYKDGYNDGYRRGMSDAQK